MAAPTTTNEVTARRLSTLLVGSDGNGGLWKKIKDADALKAPLASPALSGTPTAPTANAGTNTTQIATTAFVKQAVTDGLAEADAMIYKGTIAGGSTGSYGALTPAASKGWTYKVTTAGKIDGKGVEVGDMLICNTDSTAAATSSNYSTIVANWDFVQVNIDGAVVGPSSVTSGNVAAFDGTTGKLIKDSGYTIAKSVPSDAKFTDTTYTFDGTYNASTNKAATVSTVTNAIGALDVSNISGFGAGKTLSALSETDGKISASFQNISITKSQVSDFPTSMTPTSHASSSTTYGSANKSDYGHVKLVTGDVNGSTYTAGVAASPEHTHSQYAVPGDITTALNNLSLSQVGGDHKYISSISQSAGKVSAAATMMDSYPVADSIKAVESGGVYNYLEARVKYLKNTDNSTIYNSAPFADDDNSHRGCAYYFMHNAPDNSVQFVYNTPGYENTLIFSKNGNYGSILKWGYNDKYLYIARHDATEWKVQDFEKISAGYADTAGDLYMSGSSRYYTSGLLLSPGGEISSQVPGIYTQYTSGSAGNFEGYYTSNGAVIKTPGASATTSLTGEQLTFAIGSSSYKTIFGYSSLSFSKSQFLLSMSMTDEEIKISKSSNSTSMKPNGFYGSGGIIEVDRPDWNDLDKTGLYHITNSPSAGTNNSPENGNINALVITNQNGWITQLAMGDALKYRTRGTDGGWGAWKKVTLTT